MPGYRKFQWFLVQWFVWWLLVIGIVAVWNPENQSRNESFKIWLGVFLFIQIFDGSLFFYYKKNSHLNKNIKNVLLWSGKLLVFVVFLSLFSNS